MSDLLKEVERLRRELEACRADALRTAEECERLRLQCNALSAERDQATCELEVAQKVVEFVRLYQQTLGERPGLIGGLAVRALAEYDAACGKEQP